MLQAVIRESECIGCTKCRDACPVDAIVGSSQLMHTVLIDECIGCKLCLPPCPVDCIDWVEQLTTQSKTARAKQAKHRIRARKQREHAAAATALPNAEQRTQILKDLANLKSTL